VTPTIEDLASSRLSVIDGELQAAFPGIFDTPLGDYILAFVQRDRNPGYRHVPVSARQSGHLIANRFGANALCGYHRAILLKLIAERRADTTQSAPLPESVRLLQVEHWRRIVADSSRRTADYYSLDNDLFAKDFALCRGKLLPCGAEHVDLNSGVPRRVLLQPNVAQSIRATLFLSTMGGFRHWIESHWDRRLVRLFSHDGYLQFYHRIAEILELRPNLRGFSSYGWWYDPALDSVSPKLAFLRQIPLQAGARLLHVGSDQQSTADALTHSSERSQAFSSGTYAPRVFLMVWPRRNLLRWAQTTHCGQQPRA
jgi:hypothetical protein